MKTNKILLGGLAGGVTYFFLGWLVYGILLNSYMTANINQCASRPMEEMIWWAMILSSLGVGFLLSLVFSWSKTTGIREGVKIAAIIGLLISSSYDLGSYSMSHMYNSFSVVLVDVITYSVLLAIVAVVVILVMGKKEA